MTAKERLLEQAPTWSEEQAQRALRAVEHEPIIDAWGDLSAMTDSAAAETMQRLEEEESAAGHEPPHLPSRGEVWWYERSEQKPRPVLVITRNEAIDKLYEILVVPATRTVRGIATEVAIDREDGMPNACALSLDNTFLARKALLTERITELGPERMHEVCHALSAATDC